MASVSLTLCFCASLQLCLATTDDPQPYLLFSTWFTVSHMNLDGSDYSVLIDSSSSVGPQAVDFHFRQNKLFWNHYIHGTINQANLDGSNPEIIVSNVNRPSGLAVDWVNDKLYFSYGDPGSNLVNPNHLAIYDITAGGYTEITPITPYAVFRELAVDPIDQRLYWTDGSNILQSTLSGENVEVLFVTTASCVVSYLTLVNNYLYWTQDFCTSEGVYSLDLTSSPLQQTVIASGGVNAYYSGVTAYQGTAYWTALGRVNSAPAAGGGSTTELLYITSYGGTSFRGITVVHPDLQPSPSPTPYLVFSTWFTVSRMNLDGSYYSVLIDSSSSVGPQAVDFHFRQNKLFWNHYIHDTINQANLDGSNPEIIVSNVNRPSGLAVDWINDKLYFSYGDPGSNLVNPNHLAIYDITAGGYTEITPITPYAVFHELAVDPIDQELYWVSGSRVLQSTLSGENVEILLTRSCIQSVMYYANFLYLAESCPPESVRSLGLSTLEESIIVEGTDVDSRDGVAMYEDTAYWTGNARVYSTAVTGGGAISELLHIVSYGGAQFRGIVVVHPDIQPDSRTLSSYSSTTSPAPSSFMTTSTTPSSSTSLSTSTLPRAAHTLYSSASSITSSYLNTVSAITTVLPSPPLPATLNPSPYTLPTSFPITTSQPTDPANEEYTSSLPHATKTPPSPETRDKQSSSSFVSMQKYPLSISLAIVLLIIATL